MKTVQGYLGIDAGTQGLSVIFCDEKLAPVATGDGAYDMVPGLNEGCYEQQPSDWEQALKDAVADLKKKLQAQEIEMQALGIGISGQMHGEVLADDSGAALGSARLWCDSRNDAEGNELTALFGVKVPKRMTVARWLWTIRNQPDKAAKAAHMVTPGGWLSYRLTGDWVLGVGDASGMFPISQDTLDYDQALIEKFDNLVKDTGVKPLQQMLPTVRKTGEVAGRTTSAATEAFGLAEGIPVAPAEGDQPASLAGSLIADAGTVSMSFGTSVCANAVGNRPFRGVHPGVDHFCAPDGKPINMVFLRNGTTFMNMAVEMFQRARGDANMGATFAALMPQVLEAAPDCGGILALPFMDDEPGLEVTRGGTALFVGLNSENATPGNVIKAAVLATAFNLRVGTEVLAKQGYPLNQVVLAGGLTKTPELGQVIADVFNVPVMLLESSEEGAAWGGAVLAGHMHQNQQQATSWADYLQSIGRDAGTRFEPQAQAVNGYSTVYARYRKLLKTQPEIAASKE